MVDMAITEVLEKVKVDYKDIDVAQHKYGYSQGACKRADRDLAIAVQNAPRFLVLDAVKESTRMHNLREIMDYKVDMDKDYMSLF